MMRPLPVKFLLLSVLLSAITFQALMSQAVTQAQARIKPDSQLINIQKEITASGNVPDAAAVVMKSEKAPTARTIRELLTENCRVYPVPASSELTVSGMENVSVMEIFDVTGNKLSSEQCEGSDVKTINISHLARGIYFIRLTTPFGGVMKRFVKE